MKFKINDKEDRRAMVAALANAGYSVKVIQEKPQSNPWHGDYWVVINVEDME